MNGKKKTKREGKKGSGGKEEQRARDRDSLERDRRVTA
jgi:hypothetical protein